MRALQPMENHPVPFFSRLRPLRPSGMPATADNPAAFPWLCEQPLPQAMGDFDHRYYDYPEQDWGIKVKENFSSILAAKVIAGLSK